MEFFGLPRKLTILVAILLGLHLLEIFTLGTAKTGPILAEGLESIAAVLAAAMCFRAGHGARGMSRPFWWLFGLGIASQCFTDLIYAYYEIHFGGMPNTNIVLPVLVLVRAMFLAMALFVDPQKDSSRLDGAVWIDFTQVAIVFFFLYVNLYYIPAHYPLQGGVRYGPLQSTVVVRSVLFFLAIVQTARSRKQHLRVLHAGFLIYLGWYLFVESAALYVLFAHRILSGTLLDMAWQLPVLAVALWAGSWKPSSEPPPTGKLERKKISDLILANAAFALAPLIVVLQITQLGSQLFLLRYSLLGASILCFAARLGISEFHQSQYAETLWKQNHAIEVGLNALRESEERFRTLVRDLHVGVVLSGPDASIKFANRAALQMFGVPDLDAIGGDVSAIGLIALDAQGRELPFADRPVATVIRTKEAVRNSTMGWCRPGIPEILWIFGNAVPQFNPDGSILHVISSFTDITEMKKAEQAVHQLSMQLLKLQDEERRRIGRELHDGMAQTVLAVNLSLAQVRHSSPSLSESAKRALEKARALLQQMSREIRTLSYLLHPPLLDELGLVSALKEYVHGFSERSGIDTQLDLPMHFSRLPQTVEIALFRVVQESLANVQRHSGSGSATIRLREDPPKVTLEIIDYGRGMKLPSDGQTRRDVAHLGVGIPGMRERMAQLAGRLDIESSPSGTTVRATISNSEDPSKESGTVA